MQTYRVDLSSKSFNSFRCQKAINSCDIDIEQKLKHSLSVNVDIANHEWSIGLILGASGSGKTTLAKEMFGANCFDLDVNYDLPIIEQFDESLSYDDCVSVLTSVGLSSVPCWVRPLKTLSNGQQSRAIAALSLMRNTEVSCIDEWSSVVDRLAAKAMSMSIGKAVRRFNKKVVIVSCHFDIIDWLEPHWILNCDDASFVNYKKKTEKASISKFENVHPKLGECLASITI